MLLGNTRGPCASNVAAGVINPVTGRWAVKTWRIEELLPEAETTYHTLEAQLGIEIYHPIPLRRFCQNAADLKRIGRRLRNPRYADVLGALHAPGDSPSAIRDECGSFDILQAAYVDLPPLLIGLRKTLQFRDTQFQHSALHPSDGQWHYQDISAKKVIFCEGAAVKDNPWFDSRAMAPVKGETLLIKSPGLDLPRTLYHHKKWILPYGDESFRIGATYKENFKSANPTLSGAKELLEGARAFLGDDWQFNVVKHLAGIRPCTVDTRPIMGPHPSEDGLYLFNGLGSKGASLTPLMSRHFVDHLLHQEKIDPEVDLSRFS